MIPQSKFIDAESNMFKANEPATTESVVFYAISIVLFSKSFAFLLPESYGGILIFYYSSYCIILKVTIEIKNSGTIAIT